jgi:hypothetical protein
MDEIDTSSDETSDSSEMSEADWYDGLDKHWKRSLQHFTTRTTARKLSAAEWVDLNERVDQALGESRALSTWRNISSVVQGFKEFERVQTLPAYRSLPLDERMVYWVEWKIMEGHLTNESPKIYAKKLAQVYARITGRRSFLIREYIQSLARRGYVGGTGATPASTRDIADALRTAADHGLRMQLLAMFLLAARTDDVQRLKTTDIRGEECEGETHLVVTWTSGTKTGMTPLVDIVTLPAMYSDEMKTYLASLGPNGRPFPLGHAAITAALRRVNPALSSHSIKKGALVTLVAEGHSFEQVAFKAKHASLKLLRVYIGERLWAVGHGAISMGKTLAGSLLGGNAGPQSA